MRRRKVMQSVVLFCTAADPATLLFPGAVVDEILERATPQFIENEFLEDEVNKFSWLARRATPVGGLIQATKRELEQSPGYREILAPLALGDELRAALITSGACWGFLCLHRDLSSPQFAPAEVAFIGRLTPHMAEGLRKALLLGSTTGSKVPDEPWLFVLAEDLSVVAITPTAERWLSEVAEVDWSRKLVMPSAISAVVARLREIERNNEVYPALLPKVRLRTASGHWLVLPASRPVGPSAQAQIPLTFEVARPAGIAPV